MIDIEFNPAKDGDLFRIDHELDGTLKISDRQKELAQAYLRMNAFRALGIDYKDKFGREPKGTGPTSSNAKFNSGNYISASGSTRNDAYGTGERSYTSNTFNIIKNLSGYEQVNTEIAKAGAGDSNLISLKSYSDAAYEAYNTQNIFVQPPNVSQPDNYNDKYKQFERIAGIDTAERLKMSKARLFGVDDSNFTDLLISETGSKRQALNLSTINGNKFDAITEIGYVESDGVYTIIIHGSSESGVETTTGGTTTSGKKVTKKESIPTFGYASPQESKEIYKKLMAQYTTFNAQESAKKHLDAGLAIVGTGAGGINDAYAYAISKILQELAP